VVHGGRAIRRGPGSGEVADSISVPRRVVVAAWRLVCMALQMHDTAMETIGWDDFAKVELRVGRIVEARVFAEARKPAYLLQVDFGDEIGVRKSSAQITKLYSPDELVGKLVVGVVNFPKKQIGPVMSECLVTGFHDADGNVALCVPDKPVPLGAKLG
jgi:tRNA-binding protein